MPFGAPLYTVPKSACSTVFKPMLAIKFAEFGSTGIVETSWFHGLSGGKTFLPCKLAPGPRSGVAAGTGVGVGVGFGVGVGVGMGVGVGAGVGVGMGVGVGV